MRMIKMVCASCQQTIDLDVDHMMSFCPYCGKKLMFDADDMSRIMNRKMAEAPKPEEPKPETPLQIRPQETSDQQPKSRSVQQAQSRQTQPAQQAQNRPAQSRPAQTTQSQQAQPKQSKIEKKPLWKEYWEIADNYFSGNGVKKDRTMALQYMRKAAEMGKDAKVQYTVGYFYYLGIGTPVDYKEANKWFRLSAAQGYVDAIYILGLNYYMGAGCDVDYRQSAKLLNLIVEDERWDAKTRGEIYAFIGSALASLYFSENITDDAGEAAKCLLKSIELGFAASYMILSFMYLFGKGAAEDKNKALWYCEQYYMTCRPDYKGSAAYMLALFYDFGENGYGVRRNPARKKRLLKEAAEHGVITFDDFQTELGKVTNNFLRRDKTNS